MLVLASSSPRRRELLAQIGETFRVESADIAETQLPGEEPSAYVRRLALEKAESVWQRLHAVHDGRKGSAMDDSATGDSATDGAGDPLIVLGADTSVVCDEEVLGKPADAADAARMLRLLAGRSHQVLTGIAVVTRSGGEIEVEKTEVVFTSIPEDEMEAYIATGHPFDKAGAYGIQGHAARWIPRIEGCYFNVVGLPLARVGKMLDRARRGRLNADRTADFKDSKG